MALLVALLLLPFAVLTFCFAVELLVGLRPTSTGSSSGGQSESAVVIVPAHNEARLLGPRLSALREAAGPALVLLVADNCTDSTGSIGREAGVAVIERNDPANRGKGFALDFARQWLEQEPPGVVVVVDSDCSIDKASIDALIDRCASSGRPCQAVNLQRPPTNASPAVQLSTFAFFVKNVIRQRALQRLAGQAQLLGTGMALPWQLFKKAKLATSSIVEDIKLGQELAAAGHPPLLMEEATVWSGAETTANTLAQRQRWEGGFLNEALSQGPRRLVSAIRRGKLSDVWSALSIMIPPLALLVSLDIAALSLAGLLIWAFALSPAILWLLSLPLLLAGVGIILVWRNGGSRFVSIRALLQVPIYVAWKLPMYAGFARRGTPKEWLRTKRE